MRTVAALYVDRHGPYPGLPGVDAWFIDGRRAEQTRLGFPESFQFHRDARLYDGPFPVVVHPPCGPWGRLRHLSERPEDAELAFRALEQVRAFGGVLEHPAGSLFWDAAELPDPGRTRSDRYGGRSIRAAQSDWGHVARKWTWLYLVGVPDAALTPPPFPGRTPTHWISGSRGEGSSRAGTAVPPGIKVCSAEQRRRTPPAFAHWLISLARSSHVERKAPCSPNHHANLTP